TPSDNLAGLAARGRTDVLFGASTANDSLHEVAAGVGRTGIIVPLNYLGSAFDHKRGDLDAPACVTGSFCDDGNLCTVDGCAPGGCTHAPIAGCCRTADDCDDQNPCTTDACTAGSSCTHTGLDGGQTTCGVGACARTVVACAQGVPQSCQPGTPSQETCNGADDDCDGAIDEDVPAPSGRPAVSVSGGSATILSWTAVGGAVRYEAIRGDLGVLHASHGDFS